MVDGTALWLGARGFVVRDVIEDGDELVVAIETTSDVPVGCAACGTRARAKDRRRVRLRDAPIGGRPVQLEWHKRVWSCPEPACETNTWTEQRLDLANVRRVLTERAAQWCANASARSRGPPRRARARWGCRGRPRGPPSWSMACRRSMFPSVLVSR